MVDPASNLPPSEQRLLREIKSKQERMLRAREQPVNQWTSIAMLGMVGWSVSVPTLAGAAAGIWIDHRWPSRFSWSLMLLIGGLMLGCVHAWLRVKGSHS